jgi:hypothetical protein
MRFFLLLLFFLALWTSSEAQQIEFGQFYDATSSSVSVVQHLNFGTVIINDTQPAEVTLGSGDEGVIEIEGFPFLDVLVTINEINVLTLDGNPCAASNCQATVNLSYAYTNTGIADFAPNYENAAVMFVGNTARFQIVRRLSGPPGPPPPPSITGVALPPLQKAYIYVFGTTSSPIGIFAGNYSNILQVTVEYL